jgi:hypothetical protein
MHSSSFLSVAAFALAIGSLGSLQACFLADSDSRSPAPSPEAHPSTPPSSCSESRPQVLALDMQPSAGIGSEGDYEVKGTIRYSCSGVTVQAHVLSPDGYVRWAPAPSATEPAALSLRFAGSQKGQTVQYEVSVLDSLGNESYPPLRQSVSLE